VRTKFDIYIFIIVFSLTRSSLETKIYRTRDEHANHYTTDAVLSGATYLSADCCFSELAQYKKSN
jgi:hypothetical protein